MANLSATHPDAASGYSEAPSIGSPSGPLNYQSQNEPNHTFGSSGNRDNQSDIDPLILAENPDNIVFSADIIDGYSFRNLIEYLKTTNKKSNFIFTRQNIFYAQANANVTVLNVAILFASELSAYTYNSNLESEVVGLDISSLRIITKPIGKKDSVRLFKLVNNQLFFIQIISQNNRSSNRTNLNMVRPTTLPLQNYAMPTFTRSEEDPNCKIPASELAKTCNAINSIKCTHAWIRGFPQGIRIHGIIGNNIVGRSDSFGNTTEPVPTTIMSVEPSPMRPGGLAGQLSKRLVIRPSPPARKDTKVAVSTIKALAKLNNLCPNGIVKFHINDFTGVDDAIKLTTNISTYGRLMIYLRDVDAVISGSSGETAPQP
jgi:hypothetical protein